ncbi:MAG TPA: hypothetical protein VNV60_00290 [Holophagaceae bacterium]|nr:hypothetical protein [Holophagaceae bacterium]
MKLLAALLFACASLSAQVQGHLRFEAPGRAPIVLDLVDGGHPAFLTIPHQRGVEDGEAVRRFVLTHTGPEASVLPPSVEAKPMPAKAPLAWKVDHNGGRAQLATGYAAFWRYTPGLVIPVWFKLGQVEWRLIAADLPPKMLVSNDAE